MAHGLLTCRGKDRLTVVASPSLWITVLAAVGRFTGDTKRRALMAYKIIASQCTGCSACEFECPNAAISMKGETFIIDPVKCTECEGHFDHPKCDEICPVPKTCVPA